MTDERTDYRGRKKLLHELIFSGLNEKELERFFRKNIFKGLDYPPHADESDTRKDSGPPCNLQCNELRQTEKRTEKQREKYENTNEERTSLPPSNQTQDKYRTEFEKFKKGIEEDEAIKAEDGIYSKSAKEPYASIPVTPKDVK